MTVSIGDYARAVYDFQAETASDLALRVGDVVKVTDISDKNWAVGYIVGVPEGSGSFPLAFVESLNLPSARTGRKVFLAIQDFPAKQNGDLELSKGDIILGLEPVNESWWRGKNGPLKGIFPVTVVVELLSHEGLESRSASARSGSLKLSSNSLSSAQTNGNTDGVSKLTEAVFGRALVDVIPQLDGELGFQLGDLIEITDVVDDDWFYGRCHNKEGLVSSVCVELLVENGETHRDSSLQKGGKDSDRTSLLQEAERSRPVSRVIENVEVRTNGAFTSENTKSHDAMVTPYGRVRYPFTALVPTELSLTENSIVTLIQHLDSDWTEGELDGKRGLFPTSFIEIIVDCPKASSQDLHQSSELNSVNGPDNTNPEISMHIKTDTYKTELVRSHISSSNISKETTKVSNVHDEIHEIGLVVYNFNAELSEDVSVVEGDTVEVIRALDDNWLMVRTELGQVGQVPINHVQIIGPWPKAKSNSSVVNTTTVSAPKAAIAVNSLDTTMSASVVPDKRSDDSKYSTKNNTNICNISNSNENISVSQSLFPEASNFPDKSSFSRSGNTSSSETMILPSKGKPLVLPKPNLPAKPALAPKPTAVIHQKPFNLSRPISASKLASTSSMLDGRANILKDLDTIVQEEISKAKGEGSPKSSETQLNISEHKIGRDQTEDSVSELYAKNDFRRNQVSDTSEKENEFGSLKSTSTSISTQSVMNSEQEKWGAAYRRSTYASSFSCSSTGEHAAMADVRNRRKSASFAEQKPATENFSGRSNSSFINRAFQQDIPEGVLINISPQSAATSRSHLPTNNHSSAIVSTPLITVPSSSRAKGPPPRPTGPRVASAPPKVPLLPLKVEAPIKLVPKRPAPRAPGTLCPAVPQSPKVAPSPRSSQRRTSRIRASPATPRRPPPRPADLMSFSPPDDHSTGTAPRRPPPRPADMMSFGEQGTNTDVTLEDNSELVSDLKSRLEENRADIEKFEQTQSDLRMTLLELTNPAKEAELKDHLEFVDKQLMGLQEEGSRLRENLQAVSPHEARLEEARQAAAKHAKEEERRREEEKKREEEMKLKRREQRSKVIQEILDTEKDFLFSLQLCMETFLDGNKPPPGVDVHFLLGNMEEIADVSQKMIVHLETCVAGKSFDEQFIGKCFSHFAEDMKNTYAPYCRNHDDVIAAMERYTENPEINEYFNTKIEKMREQTNIFDIAGVLIKPVQRVLKYPLLLNELLKNTEGNHPDREEIVAAITAMTDVARAINEYKRRKDLVYKYKKLTDQTFSDKISKLNLHSIRKKSTRIRGRLSTNFGIALQTRDEKFEKEESKFRNLERAVKVFLRGVIQFLDQSQETYQYQEILMEDIREFYNGKECEETTKLCEVTSQLLRLFDNMKLTIENVVIASLNELVRLFMAPVQVIDKRFDKLLDYNSQIGKAENDKELQAAKTDYEAMNAQLLDELPTFCSFALTILKHCIALFVMARRDFMEQALKESCALVQLSCMANKSPLMETFKTRHQTVFDHISLLSFVPKGFNPRVDTVKAERAKLRGRSVDTGLVQTNTVSSFQTSEQRAHLQNNYPASKLFTVTCSHQPTDPMDIPLAQGCLVAVIKELDPMGNKDRWFVDDGAVKGFVPCTILTPGSNILDLNTGGQPVKEEDLISILSDDSTEIIFTRSDGAVQFHKNIPQSEPDLLIMDEEPPKNQYYYALYDFTPRHPNETTLLAGHPVKVLSFHDQEGNSEWWLVESETNRGYAPANYMTSVPYNP